jgi:hypothetical protein
LHYNPTLMADPLTPEQEAQAQQLLADLKALTEPELLQIARTLVAPPDGSPFGQAEFDLRDVAHRLVAKALQHALGQKKTATRVPA